MVPVAMAEPDPQQQGKTFGDGLGLPKYLAHYDVKGGPNGTGDGMLDQEECQAMEQARDQIRKQLRQDWDTDGDGQICTQEKEQAQVQLRQMIEERRLVRFEEADADDDGALSRAEFETLPGIANKLVSDPDLVDAILDPNKVISDQYQSHLVRTLDGFAVTGRAIEIGDKIHVYTGDADAPPKQIRRSDVEEMSVSKISQMPSSLIDTLNQEELKDLAAYIMSRSK